MSNDIQNSVTDWISPGATVDNFLTSTAFVKLLAGPMGSGKTSAAALAWLLNVGLSVPDSDGVIRHRTVVIRNTRQMLESNLIPTVKKIFPRSPKWANGWKKGSPITFDYQDKFLDLHIDFIGLDHESDVSRIEGATYNMGWIDEPKWVAWTHMRTLISRVRATNNKGKEQPLNIILTANKSDTHHWLYKKFIEELPGGWEYFSQPGGREVDENGKPIYENQLYLPKDYYEKMVASAEESWVKVNVDNEWGAEISGSQVVPEFNQEIHVAKDHLHYAPGLGLILGIDAGNTFNPAAVISQLVPLQTNDGKHLGNQLQILGEWFVSNMGASKAARDLQQDVNYQFNSQPVEMAWIDPAAASQSDLNEQIKFIDIWKGATGWDIKPTETNKILTRVEAIRQLFSTLVGNGQPAVLIDPGCTELIKALKGGFHWREIKTANGIRVSDDTIEKNHPESDLGDSLMYLALGAGGYDALKAVARKGRGGNKGRIIVADGVSHDNFTDSLWNGNDHNDIFR